MLESARLTDDQAIVELALRQQPRWKEALIIAKPDTVVRWHRKGFRLYWRSISKRGPGRPRISPELQDLILRFATENDWRARKIQAELEKLGFDISLATAYAAARRIRLGKGFRRRLQSAFL